MAIAVGQRAVQEFRGRRPHDRALRRGLDRPQPAALRRRVRPRDAVRRPHRARHDHGGVHLGRDRQHAARARLDLPLADAQVPRAGAAGRHRPRRGGGARLRRGQARARGSPRARSSATRSSWTARPRSSLRPDGGAGRSGGVRAARTAARDRAGRAHVRALRAAARARDVPQHRLRRVRAPHGLGPRLPGLAALQGAARAALQLPPGDRVLEPRDRAGGHPRRAADLPLGAPAWPIAPRAGSRAASRCSRSARSRSAP